MLFENKEKVKYNKKRILFLSLKGDYFMTIEERQKYGEDLFQYLNSTPADFKCQQGYLNYFTLILPPKRRLPMTFHIY